MNKIKPKHRVCGKAVMFSGNNRFFWRLSTSAIVIYSKKGFTQKINCKRSLIYFAERFGIDIMNRFK